MCMIPFSESWLPLIEQLPQERRLPFIGIIVTYASTKAEEREDPTLESDLERAIFTAIQADMDLIEDHADLIDYFENPLG